MGRRDSIRLTRKRKTAIVGPPRTRSGRARRSPARLGATLAAPPARVYDDSDHSPRRPRHGCPDVPHPTAEIAKRRAELAPEALSAFKAFSKAVFAPGALDARTKQLIAVAVAHVTQCPYCIKGHTEGAARAGASDAEIMEAIWVAAEMRAGGAYAHSALALQTLADLPGHKPA